MDALYTPESGGFYPSRYTFAGWNNGTLHGSPIAALLAYGIESQSGDNAQGRSTSDSLLLSRLTVDLPRPIRQALLKLKTTVVREGRRLKLVDAALFDGETLVARASGLLLRRNASGPGPTTLPPGPALPAWNTLPPRHWEEAPHNPEGDDPGGATQYYRSVEVRRITDPHSGPMQAWVRVPFDLLPGIPLSPVQRAAAVADFASAVGMLSRQRWQPFINADISLTLHREPKGEWMCLCSIGRGDYDGIASSSVNLHDEEGLFGHSVVTGVSNPVPVGAAARRNPPPAMQSSPPATEGRAATIDQHASSQSQQ